MLASISKFHNLILPNFINLPVKTADQILFIPQIFKFSSSLKENRGFHLFFELLLEDVAIKGSPGFSDIVIKIF